MTEKPPQRGGKSVPSHSSRYSPKPLSSLVACYANSSIPIGSRFELEPGTCSTVVFLKLALFFLFSWEGSPRSPKTPDKTTRRQ